MVNWFAPGGEAVVACRVTVWLEPSGSVSAKLIDCPALGLEARLTEMVGGEPVGPLAVAPPRVEFTPAS